MAAFKQITHNSRSANDKQTSLPRQPQGYGDDEALQQLKEERRAYIAGGFVIDVHPPVAASRGKARSSAHKSEDKERRFAKLQSRSGWEGLPDFSSRAIFSLAHRRKR